MPEKKGERPFLFWGGDQSAQLEILIGVFIQPIKGDIMPESKSHKKGKGSAARTEVPIPGKRRLDAIRGKSTIEVERGGTAQKIDQALFRLKTQMNKNKILRVPQNDMEMAMKRVHHKGINVKVTNLSKTKQIKP
ncbi:MAG: hypothetical protein OS130_11185 [Thermodesulfobacteriota bacterium]|nr:MAG: hypothetical protein OS130_11185 [Thermodesulfobacteriota bacterium]